MKCDRWVFWKVTETLPFIQSLTHKHNRVLFQSVSPLTRRICSATLQWRGPAQRAPGSTPRIWLCARGPTSSEPPPGWTSRWWPPSGPCCWWPGSRAATAWRWGRRRGQYRNWELKKKSKGRGLIDCLHLSDSSSPCSSGGTVQRVRRLCLSSGVGFQKVSTVPVFLSLMKISLSCGRCNVVGGRRSKHSSYLTQSEKPNSTFETISQQVDPQEENRRSL